MYDQNAAASNTYVVGQAVSAGARQAYYAVYASKGASILAYGNQRIRAVRVSGLSHRHFHDNCRDKLHVGLA